MALLNHIDPKVLSTDNTFCVNRNIDILIQHLQELKKEGVGELIFQGQENSISVFCSNKKAGWTKQLIKF